MLLGLVVLPWTSREQPGPRIVVLPQPMLVQRFERPLEPSASEERGPLPGRPERSRPRGAAPFVIPVVPVPRAAVGPPEAETIPETALTELRAVTMPLEATPFGIRRRAVERDPTRIARMRAESLVNARIASVVESRPAPSAGPVSLANGGVTIAIPWGGFVRDDRNDEAWREKRCRGEDDGKSDKPGEGEARRGQCG